MIQITHRSILDLAPQFSGILLDAYGVFFGGSGVGLLPGAKDAMQELVKQGKIVGILSNSSQPSQKEIEKLKKYELFENVHYHFLLTSGQLAKNMFYTNLLPFTTKTKKYWVFANGHPKFQGPSQLFEGTSFTETPHLEEADFIVPGVPHIEGLDVTDPDLFLPEIRKIMAHRLPLLCINPDRFAHEGSPPQLVVRQGSIAHLYEQLGGSVFMIGKPSLLAFRVALDAFSSFGIAQKNEIAMVGDTLETDIVGANRAEIPSILVTKTGIMADRIHKKGLKGTLEEFSKEFHPRFLIETLGVT
jgi:HAD superfamily hydrolase (TIGR01459 family)